MLVGNAFWVGSSWVPLGYEELHSKHVKNGIEEYQGCHDRDHGTDGSDIVSTSECVGVVGDTTGHSS